MVHARTLTNDRGTKDPTMLLAASHPGWIPGKRRRPDRWRKIAKAKIRSSGGYVIAMIVDAVIWDAHRLSHAILSAIVSERREPIMLKAIFVSRKHRLALAAIVVLMALGLAAGTLFAANERQRFEKPVASEQPAADVVNSGPPAGLPAAPPAPEQVPAQSDDIDVEEIDLPPIVKVPPTYPNLDSNLNRLAEQAQSAEQQPDTTGGSAPGSDPETASDPVLVTFYVEPEQVAAVRQFLEDNDVFVRHAGEDWIEAHVPPALLPAASELAGVRRVDTVISPEPEQGSGRVISQGVALHHADAWHDLGYRGQGIKVGIIDAGFERFSELQGSGELPGNVVARCYPPRDSQEPVSSSLADCEVDGAHGTAVAETIIDVAPEVQLYIAHPQSGGDQTDAIDWMVENGVHVINRSLGGGYEGPGDGTSWFSNSILNNIDTAVSGGIVFVNSAGNYARSTWHGTFNDPDGNSRHNFASRDQGNTFFLREGRGLSAYMRWEDTWGGADCDLDLLLVRSIPGPNNDILVADDSNKQVGGDNDIPYARFGFRAESADDEGQYYFLIDRHTCADDPAWIQLRVWGITLQHYSLWHSISGHIETRNPGMLSVAAAHWGSPQAIASYSSRGPTIDGRIKPDITGTACASATVYENRTVDGTECWFAGTSQASPHVAGLAALVKQRFPDYTPAQVAAYLKKYANDHERGPLGADNTWGYGLATLPPGPEPMLREPMPTDFFEVRAGENPDEAVISWVPVPEATHYRIGYVNMEVDFHLATQASCTMEADDWLQAFVYVDVKALNVPVKDGRAEYTIRRLSPGARHAFTVLPSQKPVQQSTERWRRILLAPESPLEVCGRAERPAGGRCHSHA